MLQIFRSTLAKRQTQFRCTTTSTHIHCFVRKCIIWNTATVGRFKTARRTKDSHVENSICLGFLRGFHASSPTSQEIMK